MNDRRHTQQIDPDPDDITDSEGRVIEERAARMDLATGDEIEALFSRYRQHQSRDDR